MSIAVQKITTGRWEQNCYIIADRNACAILIDPGDNAESIHTQIVQNNLNPQAILCTHGHHDHIGAVAFLKRLYDVPFYLHSKDIKTLKGANFYRILFDKAPAVEIPKVDEWLDDLEMLNFGEITVQVLHTPGHTPGGVSFKQAGKLFAGDNLFKDNIGRTDLPGGNLAVLASSLRLIADLPPATQIYSGHGETTDLATELRSNAALLELLN